MRSISCGLTKTRPGFSQRVNARAGSVASPVLAAYDPDPDYFFHWFRDSAIVIDALRLLPGDGLSTDVLQAFVDFVDFSLSLQDLDGESLAKSPEWRAGVAPNFQQYLRSNEDLACVQGTRCYDGCGEPASARSHGSPRSNCCESIWPPRKCNAVIPVSIFGKKKRGFTTTRCALGLPRCCKAPHGSASAVNRNWRRPAA
jgi:hypothetical protein